MYIYFSSIVTQTDGAELLKALESSQQYSPGCVCPFLSLALQWAPEDQSREPVTDSDRTPVWGD